MLARMTAPAVTPPEPSRPVGPDAVEPGARSRGLWLLAVVVLLAMLPVTLPVAGLRIVVQQRFDVGDLATSSFMAVNMLGALVGGPWIGALGDRLGGRQRIAVMALLADALLFAALAQVAGFVPFLLLRALEGFAHLAALSSLLALGAASAHPVRRGRTMGLLGAALTLGVALGAPLGGRLAQGGMELPLWVGAGLLGVAALLAAVVPITAHDAPPKPTWAQILSLPRAQPALRVPLAFAFVDRFTVGFFTTTFPLWLAAEHGAPPARIGTLLALFLVPFALLSYPCGRIAERGGFALLVGGGSAAYGAAVILLPWLPQGWLAPWMLVLGLTSAVMFVPSLLLAVELAGPGLRGSAIGAFQAAGSLGFFVGPLVAGALAGMGGAELAFGVAGGAELLCALWASTRLLRLR